MKERTFKEGVLNWLKQKIQKYHVLTGSWPARELMLQFMNNHHSHGQGKAKTNKEQPPQDVGPSTAGPSSTTTAANPSNDRNDSGGQDGGIPDVSVSNVDDVDEE